MNAPRTPAWICDLGRVHYPSTLELQRSLRAAREAGVVPDTVLVLEHEPVITCGTRTEHRDIAEALTRDIPVIPVERGGKATWHGPGQVVVYPVLELATNGNDVKLLVHRLEQAIIDTLASWDVMATRVEGLPGVWVGDPLRAQARRKIASLGLRVSRGVAFHGIALNVDCDLEPFTWFTPCGIPDAQMTSLAIEVGSTAPIDAVRARLVEEVATQFDLALVERSPEQLRDEIPEIPHHAVELHLPDAPASALPQVVRT